MYYTNLQQIKWVSKAMVQHINIKMQHINIKTAINIQKTCIPPQKSSATERRGTGRVAIVSTRTEKVRTSNFNAGDLRNHYFD